MKKKLKASFTAIRILKISTFCVFIGRAWQHLFWDSPFRTLLWDERLLKKPVESILNIPWQTFVTLQGIDDIIEVLDSMTITSFSIN